MKKIVLLLFISWTSFTAFSQQTTKDTTEKRTLSADGTQYKASNGKIYKKGSTIQLGAGTGTNGYFRHVNLMLGNLVLKTKGNTPGEAGMEFTVDSIRIEKIGAKRVFAVSKNKRTGNLAFFIEAGLASGEIKE